MDHKNENFEAEILEEMRQQEYANSANMQKRTFKELIQAHKLKSIYTVLLIITTAICCVPMYRLGDKAAIRAVAHERVNKEIDTIQREYNQLDEEKKQLETTIYNLTQSINQNSSINVKIKDDEEKLAALAAELDAAKRLSETLDEQLNEKRGINNQVNSLNSNAEGKSRDIKAGTYQCTSDIEAGSYRLSGSSGNIIVYDISNSVRISKNLERLDGNEFTFSISSGEKLKIDKDMKLTEMK